MVHNSEKWWHGDLHRDRADAVRVGDNDREIKLSVFVGAYLGTKWDTGAELNWRLYSLLRKLKQLYFVGP